MSLRDIALALLVIVIWAGNVIAIKLAVAETAPLTALALRFGLTGLVFAPFARGLTRATVMHLLSIAMLMGFLHQGLLFLGMAYLPAGITSILLQSQVIFAALIGIFIFREKTGWRTWTGIALGVAGIAIMVGAGAQGQDSAYIHGFLILIASTLALAFAYMRMKQLPPVAPMAFLFGINGLAFPPILIASFVMDAHSWTTLGDADWLVLGAVFAFQIVFVGLSHILWQRLLARNPISLVTPFVLLLPVLGVAMAIVMLGESLTMAMVAGAVVTMLGVTIIVMRQGQKKREHIVITAEPEPAPEQA